MNNRTFNSQFLWIGAVILITGVIVWYFRTILIYVLVSAILSYILNPLVNLLSRLSMGKFKLPRWIGTIVAFGALIGLIIGFISLFLPVLSKEMELLRQVDPEKVVKTFGEQIRYVEQFLISNSLTEQPVGFIMDNIKGRVTSFLNVANLSNIVNEAVSVTGDLFFAIFAIGFMTFFMVREEHLFKRTFVDFFPQKYTESLNNAFSSIESLLSRYFIGVLIQSTLIVTLVSIGLAIVGVENALVIGVFAGFINVIPYLGPLIAIIFGLIVGITSSMDLAVSQEIYPLLLKILLIFGIVQIIDNIIFQPIIFARSVYAHPLEIFLVVIVGAQLGGAIGMFIAIPAYTIIRVTLKEFFNSYKVVQKLTKDV
ncbi:AI-2E family transporter [bacterium AH-315-C07]|nr:AI-2E family transporter [bacterium AH-315-C07]